MWNTGRQKALELGLNDKNIRIVDIGLNGLTAEDLVKRNKHNISLDKIKFMMDSYRSIGEITVEKIINAKDMFKLTSVLYSAVILDMESINEIFYKNYPIAIPDGWLMDKDLKYFCDHMTINLGELEDKTLIGKEIKLTVTHIGISDMAIALKVNGFELKNNTPHITLAINPDGGSPKMSNKITEWTEIKPFRVSGIISEVDKYKNNNKVKLFCETIKKN